MAELKRPRSRTEAVAKAAPPAAHRPRTDGCAATRCAHVCGPSGRVSCPRPRRLRGRTCVGPRLLDAAEKDAVQRASAPRRSAAAAETTLRGAGPEERAAPLVTAESGAKLIRDGPRRPRALQRETLRVRPRRGKEAIAMLAKGGSTPTSSYGGGAQLYKARRSRHAARLATHHDN